MRVIATSAQVADLAKDLAGAPARAKRSAARVTRSAARSGAATARSFARESAGSHGKHYPRSISHEMTGVTEAEFGPDAAMPQGGMSFEWGSRNQAPHLDLNRAADIVVPKWRRDVTDAVADELLG